MKKSELKQLIKEIIKEEGDFEEIGDELEREDQEDAIVKNFNKGEKVLVRNVFGRDRTGIIKSIHSMGDAAVGGDSFCGFICFF